MWSPEWSSSARRYRPAEATASARPVGRGGDEAEALAPEAVRAAHQLARPACPRLRLAALAVPRGAALAVRARGRRAAALTPAGVAGLARPGLRARGVVQVAPDGGG